MILTAAPHVLLVPMVPHLNTDEYSAEMGGRSEAHAFILDNMRDPNAKLWGIYTDGELRGTVRLWKMNERPDMAVHIFDGQFNGLAHLALRRVREFVQDMQLPDPRLIE